MFYDAKFDGRIINFDKLTYAGNISNLLDIEQKYSNKQYAFYKGDICDLELLKNLMSKYDIDTIINFAAETHVDRSIASPEGFINTNIKGTFTLLECAKNIWKNRDDVLFHHISTDEVYGSLGSTGFFYETTPYDPRSPYSASKASSDHLVKSYFHTYSLPVTISNCSNNYGPYQYPEKLIPLMILNILSEKSLPVYGDGKNIRDWLYVKDHADAVLKVIEKGKCGETYNIGGENEIENIALVNTLCENIAEIKGKHRDYYKKLINFVKDRPGHDRRYAINCDKIKNKTGWSAGTSFEEGIKHTINWYSKAFEK
jgi:dTDP-glucose 4,6-dehydratase